MNTNRWLLAAILVSLAIALWIAYRPAQCDFTGEKQRVCMELHGQPIEQIDEGKYRPARPSRD